MGKVGHTQMTARSYTDDQLPKATDDNGMVNRLIATIEASKKLCEIYFNIASEELGDTEVRRRRDRELKKVNHEQ